MSTQADLDAAVAAVTQATDELQIARQALIDNVAQITANTNNLAEKITNSEADDKYMLQTDFVGGQCVLVKDSNDLRLKPYNGNKLIINSKVETIPDAGIAASPSGLVANTVYFIYARMNSGTMELDFANAGVTTHSTQVDTGVEIYTGDPTRTLVGIARTNSSLAWEDSAGKRYVRSWFNRTPVELKSELNATVATTSTAWIELNSNKRIGFVSWRDEVICAGSSGRMANTSSTGRLVSVNIGLDGASTLLSEGSTGGYGAGAMSVPASCSGSKTLQEGYHYITLLGCANVGGTAVFYADGANETDVTGLTGVLM